MAKPGFLLLLFIIGAITKGTSAADTPTPCVTKAFKTQLAKAACAKGGQKAAKEAMQAWNKEKNIKSCNQCHAKLAPSYKLKDDAVAQFQKLGGIGPQATQIVVLLFAKTAMIDGESMTDAALERYLREAVARDKDIGVSFSTDTAVSNKREMDMFAIVKRVGVARYGTQYANYTDPDNPPKQPVISIDRTGTVYVNKRIVLDAALDNELAKLAKKKDKRVVLAVDRSVTDDAIEAMIARCKAAGLDATLLE